MDEAVKNALEQDRIIDITTTGRKSGQPSRKEIWYHRVDGEFYITGTPGPRDWYANVIENPEFTFHLKESAEVDLEARAEPITDERKKREILGTILERLERADQIDKWVEDSPLIRVEFVRN